MAQIVVAAAGAAVGFMVGGPGGAQAGWVLGSMLGSTFGPTQKAAGPRLSDLNVSSSAYGNTIPYVAGHPRISGQIVWASSKREIATTQRQGKGGGGSEVTTYTYEIDLLYLVSANEIPSIHKVWSNGELVFNYDTIIAPDLCSRMTFYTGASTQLPDPDYEAAVGISNALAYRGRGSIFIKSLQLGSSGQIPNLTFEVGYSADIYDSGLDVLFNMDGSSISDNSGYGRPVSVVTNYGLHTKTTDGLGNPTTPTQSAAVPGAFGGSAIQFNRDHTSYVEIDCASWWPSSGPYWFEFRFQLQQWEPTTEYGGLDTGLFMRAESVGSSIAFNACIRFPFARGPLHTYINNSEGRVDTSWQHYILYFNGTNAVYEGVNGTWYTSYSRTNVVPFTKVRFGNFYYQTGLQVSGTISGAIEEFRVVRGIYNSASFAPGTSYTVLADTLRMNSVDLFADKPLVDTVIELCSMSGLDSTNYDTSELVNITTPVYGMSISQISTTRTILSMLAAAYNFDMVLSDKIYFRSRARSPVYTIPLKHLGKYLYGGSAPESLKLSQLNELEIPAQLAITYSNVDGDYQSDTQYSDRLLTGMDSISNTQLPLVFNATKAKQIADSLLLDKAISSISTTIQVSIDYAALEPTDVIIINGSELSEEDRLYRMRVIKKSESEGIITLSCVRDNGDIFTQQGITDGGTAGQTEVVALPVSDILLLDIPLLREIDDKAGIYIAVKAQTLPWPGAAIYESTDTISYSFKDIVGTNATLGTCTTTLANWTSGNKFDESNTVAVNIGYQELTSVDRNSLLANISTNLVLIGNELIQYKTAELISTGIYKLSSLLRGRRGTSSTGHTSSERFVLISGGGVKFLPISNSQLGASNIYYKAVTSGLSLTNATSTSILPIGILSEPFAPIVPRVNRDSSDSLITWIRQTRYATRYFGPLGQYIPVAEESENYLIEIYSNSSYTTLLRTAYTSVPQYTYTAANQVLDFGTTQSILYIKVYQISATVGKGYPLVATV